MAQLKVKAADFSLICKFACMTTEVYKFPDESSDVASYIDTQYGYKSYPETQTKNVSFSFGDLQGATIKSAKVYATLGSPLYGAETCKINGVSVDVGNTRVVDVAVADGATSVDVPFQFLCRTPVHGHEDYDPEREDDSRISGLYWYHYWYFDHESELSYKDVYLLIEYTPAFTPPELIPYTDPAPVAFETYVKAVHMTELHTNANLVREAYKLPAYDFPAIVAGQSPLANWNADVIEIRVALDTIGVAHEDWLLLDFNRPRLDVLLQLRRVVAVLAAGDGEQAETVREQFYTADGELMATADGLYFKVLEGTT